MGIGILVHGLNLTNVVSEYWERLVWGKPPDKLGRTSATVLEVLNAYVEGIEVDAIVFGSGASEKDGLKEAEYTKRFLLEHLAELEKFVAIANHPGFQAFKGRNFLKTHLEQIICEVGSQNTLQEMENAATIFATRGITHVIDISCGSHLPRCVVIQQQAREAGKIPHKQRWYAVASDMTYDGLPIQESVIILEAPNRGDDPMMNAPIKQLEVIRELFELTGQEKIQALVRWRDIIRDIKRQRGN